MRLCRAHIAGAADQWLSLHQGAKLLAHGLATSRGGRTQPFLKRLIHRHTARKAGRRGVQPKSGYRVMRWPSSVRYKMRGLRARPHLGIPYPAVSEMAHFGKARNSLLSMVTMVVLSLAASAINSQS